MESERKPLDHWGAPILSGGPRTEPGEYRGLQWHDWSEPSTGL